MAATRKKTKLAATLAESRRLLPEKSDMHISRHLTTEDLPILLRNDEKKLIAGIKLETQELTNNELRLTGWCLGSSGLALLCDGKETDAEIRRAPRDDVLGAHGMASEFDPGFEIVIDDPAPGDYKLRWEHRANSNGTPLDFQLAIQAPSAREEDSGRESTRQASGAMAGSTELAREIKHHIECILEVDSGIVLVGWVDDRSMPVSSVFLQTKQRCPVEFPLSSDGEQAQCLRTYRPDVYGALEDKKSNISKLGIVAWFPFTTSDADEISVAFGKNSRSRQSVPLTVLDGDGRALERTLIHSGPALRTIAEERGDLKLRAWLEDKEIESIDRSSKEMAAIDHAFVLFGKVLLLHGWIAAERSDIVQMELVAGNIRIDIQERLVKVARLDLFSVFPWLKPRALGFMAFIDETEFLASAHIKLRVRTRTYGCTFQIVPNVADWSELLRVMNGTPGLVEPAMGLLSTSAAMSRLPGFKEHLAALLRANFLAHHKILPNHWDSALTTVAAIDRVFALREGGLLIFGWHHEPEATLAAITVHGSDEGQVCDVTRKFFPLARLDVSQGLRKRFPDITDMCGFVCHVPLPTQPGEPRAICFRFSERGNVWLKLATMADEFPPLQLIRNILGTIPAPDKIRGSLYDLFDQALGHPMESISASNRKIVSNVLERQFGKPPASPTVSVIVPLYGRYDFLRHQLAHFADDPDFDNVDLMYVIDDPAILASALDMAAAYHQLFGKPFRLVWYDKNLGFAGANNIGVRVSRGDTVLLLNSDILPKANGWLSILVRSLEELPQAGAVGPLLQFADDSVQHAGMHPRRDPYFPGFLLNVHPGKGLAWTKGDEPSRHPMLTAACLMLRKNDYWAVGGLDEGYLVGDFEDSDLCLKLRKRGLSLWLVPATRLWHLERQSQNLENVAGHRQLLTLFNGWRYRQKILTGKLADPEGSEA